MKDYIAKSNRYHAMDFRRCGRSGIKLPLLSLGLWHNFGGVDTFEPAREIILNAFNAGITHFDLANNYGPPPGSAETTFGQIMKKDLQPYRDEIIISTKAGYLMWPGPYGEWGSRKYLLASLDQSLLRMQLSYVDIFYSHRYDPDTPIDETMGALASAVHSGKALYAGISNYPPAQTLEACRILKELHTPCLIHQVKYSLFQRDMENGLSDILMKEGLGCIAFSPLAQGMLTDRYLQGIPENSRAAKTHGFLKKEEITQQRMGIISRLNDYANSKKMTLAELALNWVKSHSFITSVLIGVSSLEQLNTNLNLVGKSDFTDEEMLDIEAIMKN